jgi:hypothetical protein
MLQNREDFFIKKREGLSALGDGDKIQTTEHAGW